MPKEPAGRRHLSTQRGTVTASNTPAMAQQQGKSIPPLQVRARFLYNKYFKSKLPSQAGTAWD